MKKSFHKVISQILEEADIIVMVLDARLIHETRNSDIEEMIKRKEKRLLYCINKCDLVTESFVKNITLKPSVYVSAKKRYGSKILRDALYKIAAKSKSEQIVVGVLGYPNTGKSSIINYLKGRTSAPVASRSGKTRGVQKIRISQRLMLLDSPGVIPVNERDPVQLGLLSSKNPDQIKDIDLAAQRIIDFYAENNLLHILEEKFECKISQDTALEQIALKRKRLLKGGEPDIDTISKILVQDWQKGKCSLV